MSNSRKMPSKLAIKNYWCDYLLSIEKFDSRHELFEEDYCFACGMLSKTEKAHIIAKVRGGLDSKENIHLLCKPCHKMSEYLEGDLYFTWLKDMNLFNKLLIINNQYNPNILLQLININIAMPKVNSDFDAKQLEIEYER